MAFDPYAPYGPLVDTTVRVATWNVWGRHGGNWLDRHAGISDALVQVQPDIVCLAETWAYDGTEQSELLAHSLGVDHHVFVAGWEVDDWSSGLGVVSRWPLSQVQSRELHGPDGSGFGSAVHVVVEGERGPIQLFVAVLDYPLDGSARRRAQVRELAAFIQEASSSRYPTVVCGDFNAGPDSDEIRMLTGQSVTALPHLVFYDSWEVAGDGTPGYTWDNRNPLAAVGLYPNRRFDYILSAWPRTGGAGHPTGCWLLGYRPPDQPQLSDHYGVVADLRY